MKKVTPYELEIKLKSLNKMVSNAPAGEKRNQIFNELNQELFINYLEKKNQGYANDENLEFLTLVEFNLSLSVPFIKKYASFIKNESREDIDAVTRAAIISAIGGYRLGEKASFASYCHEAVFREFYKDFVTPQIKDYRQGLTDKVLSFDEITIFDDKNKSKTVYDPTDPDGEAPFRLVESNDSLKSILKYFIYLNPIEQYYLAKHIGLVDGVMHTKASIGEELGLTRERARQRIQSAQLKLRILLTDNNKLNHNEILLKRKILKKPRFFIEPVQNLLFSQSQAQEKEL